MSVKRVCFVKKDVLGLGAPLKIGNVIFDTLSLVVIFKRVIKKISSTVSVILDTRKDLTVSLRNISQALSQLSYLYLA